MAEFVNDRSRVDAGRDASAARPATVPQIRMELAGQMRTRYQGLQTDLPNTLEGYAGYSGVLVLVVSPTKGTKRMPTAETTRLLKKLQVQSYIDNIIRECEQVEGKDQLPRGVELLKHKAAHAFSAGEQGRPYESRFGLDISQFGGSPRRVRESMMPVVESLVRYVLANPSTIIVHTTTIHVVDAYGRGLNLNRQDISPTIPVKRKRGERDIVFSGFIDSASYHKPRSARRRGEPPVR